MADFMQIGVSGLLAAQRQIATTSHNISNANVEGYSRQRVELGTRPPHLNAGMGFGQGVMVQDIERHYDQFLTSQLRDVGSENQRLTMFHTMASHVDDILADPAGGITPALQSFFNAVQDVADDPGSIPARIALIDQAGALSTRFDTIDAQMQGLADDANRRMGETVNEINGIASALHEVNQDILNARGNGRTAAPDMLDRRDQLLSELSDHVNVQVIEHPAGNVSVMVAQGQALVSETEANQLVAQRDPANSDQLRIAWRNGAGSTVDVTKNISGGNLGGLLDFQGGMLDTARNSLGRIAMGIADQFNNQHREGMTLNGALGGDFFSVGGPRVRVNSDNTGNAAVTATVTDVGALTTDDYNLSYDGANWTLASSSGGNSVTGAGPALTLDGFSVNVGAGAAAGDSYLIQPTLDGASSLSVAITEPRDIAAASPVRVTADLGNGGNGEAGGVEILDASNPALQTPVNIVFNNPPSTFDIVDAGSGAVLAGGQAYTPGADIDFNGWRMQISNSPVAGDQFAVEPNTGGNADNSNMLAMSDLQNIGVLEGGSASFQDAYSSTVGFVGSQTRYAEINRDAQGALVQTLQARRDSVSGVNLDEEAANLVRFQQAYQASARIIGVADDLFNSLLNVI